MTQAGARGEAYPICGDLGVSYNSTHALKPLNTLQATGTFPYLGAQGSFVSDKNMELLLKMRNNHSKEN